MFLDNLAQAQTVQQLPNVSEDKLVSGLNLWKLCRSFVCRVI